MNNKGLSLIEVLVAMIVGSIMVATMYFSFGAFSGTYLGIIAKVQVSKDIRNSLTLVTKDVRLAGYTSTVPIQSGVSFAPFTTINNKIIIRKNTYFNQNSTPGSYASGSNDVLEVIYDQDRNTRVRVSYAQSNDGFLKKRYSKCLTADCLNDSDYNYNLVGFYDYQPITSQSLEGFKVTAFNFAGTPLDFSQANQANFLRVSVLYSSVNNSEIHKTDQAQTFQVEELTVSKNDKYFRDMATVLIYPRNIQKLK
jgi:prepilin-type N-terminal cleavage/methylation domain-containing protein